MESILITGGTGFVSGYLAEYYVEKGFEVSVPSVQRVFHAFCTGGMLSGRERLQWNPS